jgi:hypothetical protein
MLDGDDASLDDLDEPDWNWVEDELMVDDANDFPTVGGSDVLMGGSMQGMQDASLITGLDSSP